MEFKNLKAFKSEDSKIVLLSGNVSINNSKKNGVLIPPLITEDCNIIIPQSMSYILHSISSAPVTNTNINIYDQEGNIFNKYSSNRESNKPGNLFYKTSSKMTLNSIVIPPGQNNYLLLPEYLGAEACKLDSTRSKFIEWDYPKNFESKNLTVFTTKKVMDFGVKFPYDVEVVILDSLYFTEAIIEHFFGKNFGDPTVFVKTLVPKIDCNGIVSVTKNPSITISCRKDGNLEFFTSEEEANSDFVILMTKPDEMDYLMDFTYDIEDTFQFVMFNDSIDEKISKVLPLSKLYYDYKKNENEITFNDFFKEHSSMMLEFMITNNFSDFVNINNIVDIFFNKIHDNLFSLINQNFSMNHSKHKFHPKYASLPSVKDIMRLDSGGTILPD